MIGNKIKKLREERRLTQKELAEEMNLAQSTIAMIENDKKEGSTKTLKKLADFFNVTLDYLLSEDDEKDKINEYEEQNKLFFSKFGKLSPKDKNKIIKMIDMFEEETND